MQEIKQMIQDEKSKRRKRLEKQEALGKRKNPTTV